MNYIKGKQRPILQEKTLTSSGHLEARDGLEVHHLQHLLGLSVDLDDILERERVSVENFLDINYESFNSI